ncbi:MAG: choice-of-anchor Q domain-containing protein [Gammaproteobacteria bacterium]
MKKYLFLSILLCCQVVEATIILVDSNQDTQTNDGNCTLKEALLAANLNVAVDQCPAGQTFPTQDVIELLPNVLNDAIELGFQYPIIEGVSIIGPGSDKLVLYPSVNNTGHIFQINTSGQDVVSLSGFRIGGAKSSAIDVVATNELIIDDVKFINNSAGTSSSGGAINAYNSGGWIRVYNSEFINNQATSKGGAIYLENYLLDVSDTIFTNNSSSFGGSIYHYGTFNNGIETFIINRSEFINNHNNIETGNNKISIKESLFMQNTGTDVFLSVFSKGYIENSLFIENTATNTIHIHDNTVNTVRFNTFTKNQGFEVNSTLNSNTQVQRNAFDTTVGCIDDATSTPTYHRNVDSGTSCSGSFAYDIKNTDSKLLPLGFYGGSRLITPPSISSPLVDVDSTSGCTSNTRDLSGIGRPHDGDGNGTAECDIGAVELPEDFDYIFINGFE